MKYDKKQTYIEKFNFSDGDNFVEKGIPDLTRVGDTAKLEKNIYKQLKKILKNYSENLPPLYLIDRRAKKNNSKYNDEKRDKDNSDRRKLQRRKNNFDRRHPQGHDAIFSYEEDDRRKEFSDRRDWIDLERRTIDKKETVKSIKKIAELIASYKIQKLLKKENFKKQSSLKPEETLLMIKSHLTEGYHFGSEELVYDVLTELNSFMQGEKFFCGKLSDNSLGFYYYWIDGRK